MEMLPLLALLKAFENQHIIAFGFRRCRDDGHAGLHALGFVLVAMSSLFSLRKRMVEMFFNKESGFSKPTPRKN